LQLRIQDDGCGVTEETLNMRRSGHYGIAGMRERAERLGARMSIRSRVGEGTEVNLSIPAHLVYEDGAAGSGSRVADWWHSVIGRPKIRKTHETHS
jgi:signal transduction histidine kinase